MPPLESLKFEITWKQAVRIIVVVAAVVAGYYKMLGDIQEAMRLPEPEVTRDEYNLKFEATAIHLQRLQHDAERMELEIDRLRDRLDANENP